MSNVSQKSNTFWNYSRKPACAVKHDSLDTNETHCLEISRETPQNDNNNRSKRPHARIV